MHPTQMNQISLTFWFPLHHKSCWVMCSSDSDNAFLQWRLKTCQKFYDNTKKHRELLKYFCYDWKYTLAFAELAISTARFLSGDVCLNICKQIKLNILAAIGSTTYPAQMTGELLSFEWVNRFNRTNLCASAVVLVRFQLMSRLKRLDKICWCLWICCCCCSNCCEARVALNVCSPKSIEPIGSDSILTPVEAIAPFKFELTTNE